MPANGEVINLSLNMTANTEQAKQQLKELSDTLSNLTSSAIQKNSIGGKISKDLNEAVVSAQNLKRQLEAATNIKTGQLDLGLLSSSLKKSGTSLTEYRQQFQKLGPEGAAAFNQVAESISTAASPMRQSSKLLDGLWTNLKKVATWQISSSVLHGFMGAIQNAYGYVQDLNESLNNIQIVTQKNTAEMAKFAQQANKSAKQLSTTTTAYTDAALIFYQQGLDGKDVTDRTDVVMKMANVTKESATEVSNQMTAIWNNFDDGSESMEHYADVITNLGAHTASSSKEIAEGLEKFAPVTKTIGLSYEYATSALATVVAQTRESADTVGTAFKTIFARIDGLKLGETLEDGTDLNKYSEALQTVGVNIKDTDGQLKDMDTILDELGAKWSTLGKDQQTALAQTVAGTRQYTKLMALMDNWGTFQDNLATAENSDGTLEEQQEIYAKSWEGASKRVQAAMEEMYSTLLNDEFFIQITNIVADLVNGFTGLIKTLGGLPGLLTTIGPLLLRIFSPQIGESIDKMVLNIRQMLPAAKKDAEALRQTAAEEQKNMMIESTDSSDSYSQGVAVAAFDKRTELQQRFAAMGETINEETRAELQILLDINKALQEKLATEQKIAAEKQSALNEVEGEKTTSDFLTKSDSNKEYEDEVDSKGNKVGSKNAGQAIAENVEDMRAANMMQQKLKSVGQEVQNEDGTKTTKVDISALKEYNEYIKEMKTSTEGFKESFENAFSGTSELSKEAYANLEKMLEKANELEGKQSQIDLLSSDASIDEINQSGMFEEGEITEDNRAEKLAALKTEAESLEQEISGIYENLQTTSETVLDTAKGNLELISEDLKEKFEEAGKEAEQALVDIGAEIENLATKGKDGKFVYKTDDAKKQLDVLAGKISKLYGVDSKKLGANFQQAFDKMAKAGKSPEQIMKTLEKYIERIRKQAGKDIEIDIDGLDEMARDAAEAEDEIDKLGQGVQNNAKSMEDRLNGAGEKVVGFGQKIAKMASAAMAITGVVNSFKQLGEIWSSDASFGEKLGQTLMQLGPLMLNVAQLINEDNINMVKGIAIRSKEIVSRIASTIAKKAEAKADQEGTSAKGASIVATIAQTVANWALNASLGPLLIIILAITLAIIALVAIIWAIVAAFQAWQNSTPEAKLEESKKASKELDEQLKSTKESAEKLKNAFNEYDTAIDKLNECTKGTKEWQEALQEANNKALELQELDPSIELKRNADGLLEVAEESREAAEKAANKKVNVAQMASYQGKQDVKDQQLALDVQNLAQDKIHTYGEGWEKAGEALSILSGPSGWVNGSIFSAQREGNEQDAINKVIEAASKDNSFMGNKDDFTKKLQELGISSQGLIDSLYDNRKELQNLGETVAANTKAKETQNAEMAKQTLDSQGGTDYKNSEYQNEISMVAGRQMDAETEKTKQDILDNLDQVSFFGAKTNEKKDTIMRFQKATGMNFTKDDITDAEGQTIKIKVTNENGEQEEKEFSRETIAQTIAAAEANEKLATAGEALAKTFEDLKDAGNEGLIKFLSDQNFDNVKKGEFTDVKSEVVGSDGKVDDTKLNDYVNKQFGGDDNSLSEEEAKALGFDSVEALKKSFKEGVENAEKAWEDTDVDNTVSANIAEKMSLEQAKSVKQNFKKVIGEEGKQALSDAYSDMLSGLDDEKFDQAVNALNEVDWSAWDAGEQAKEKLDELGISTKLTAEDWEKLNKKIRESNGSLPTQEFGEFKKTLEAISSVASELKIGDEISEKDYKELTKYNEALKENFVLTSNGKYKVINDDMYGDTTKISEMISKMKEYKNIYDQVNGSKSKTTRADGKTEVKINDYLNERGEALATSDSKDSKDQRKKLYKEMSESSEYADMKKAVMDSLDLTEEDMQKQENLKKYFAAVKQIMTEGANGDYDSEAVTEGLIKSVKSIEDLNTVMSEGQITTEQYEKVVDSMLVNTAEDFGMGANEIVDYAKSLQQSAKSSDKISDSLANNELAAKKVALANTRMNQGVKDLKSNIDKYKESLKTSKVGTQEFSSAITSARKDVGNLLNINGDALSDSFFTSAKNLKLMEKAANGNTKAIEKLRVAASDDIIANVKAEFSDEDTRNKIDKLHNYITDYLSDKNYQIGVELDNAQFLNKCQEMIDTAQMSVEEASAYFQSLGYDAELETKTIEVPSETRETKYEAGKSGKKGKKISDVITKRTDKITVAAVKSLTYTGSAGGTINASNTNGGSSGSSGSSGGSDSGSKSKEDKKDLNDELERYHVINKQIDAQTKKLELLSSAKDRAYGKDRLKIMDQEIAAQKKSLKLEEKKAKEINKNVKKDAGFMKGYGANIGKDGTITNYRQIMKKQVDKYNAAVKKYNNSSQSDADKNALEAAKKNYETFKNHLENYEDSIEKSQDQAAKIAEEKAKLLQLKLAKIDYKLEIRVELDDRKLAKLEKQLSRLQNSNFSQAKQVTNINKQANVLMDEADATRSAMRSTIQAGTKKNKKKLSKNQINKIMNGEMSNKQLKKLGMSNDTIEQLKKYRDSLDDINDKLYDLKLQIPDTVNSFMNEYLSKMDEGIQKIEHQKQLWQNIQNITDLINPSLDINQRLSKQDKIEGQRTTIANVQANVSAKKAYEDIAKQEYEQYQKAYNDAMKADKNMSAEEKKKWEDSLKEREKAWKDAELATQQATIDALTAIQEAWKQIAAAIIEDGKKAADEAASQYSRIKEERDLYYKDYQRMYETSKLMRQINQSKDKTNNLKSQQAYNNLLEEVAQYQKDGAEMSKYDIEYLQKKYALTEAQIALEEARDAKSQVSLSRDAEGNMGYVYTADTSKVASAEQNYEDKLYALQDFVQKSTDELANSWVQAEQKMYQEIEAINNDMTLSEEQKVAKLTEIANHYDLVRKYYAGELDNLMEHGKEVNSDFVGYNGEQNDYLAEDIRDTIFNEIYPDLEEGINNFDDLYENHSTYLHETIMPELKDALSQYGEDIRTTATNGGIDVKQFKKEYKNMADTVVKKSGEAADSVEEMKKKQKTEYDKVKKEVDAWYKNVKNNVNKCIKKNEKAADSVDKITTAYGKAKKAASDATKEFNNAATAAQKAAAASAKAAQAATAAASANNNNNNSGGGTDDGSSDKTKYVKITARVHGFEGTYYVVSSQWSNGKIKKGTKASEVLNSVGGDINFPVSDIESPKKVDGPKTKDKFGFASGGYTGEWGSKDGKLAFLHEKELVLNQDDTENMLKMIEIVRKYNKEIQTLREAENIAKYKGELKIINQQIQAFEEINSKLKSLTAGIQLASASIKAEKKNEDLLQKVEIKAEFPSVRDRTEIEEAFENLVNKAAQFANQKTR